MKRCSKRHTENVKKVDVEKMYSIEDAVGILKSLKKAKFDESVDLVMDLKINPKKPEQLMRGAFAFPKGTGKAVKVIAIVEGDDIETAKNSGATDAGGDELIEKIQKGWMDFDVVITTPPMMRKVGKLGKTLGPQGKMPSPKSGTVTQDIENVVKEFVAGKSEYRNDDGGNVHISIGRISFSNEDLVENAKAFTNFIISNKPSTVKDPFVLKTVLSTTMGPGICVAV